MQLGELHDELDPAVAEQVIADVDWALQLLEGPIDYDHINDAIETLERARGRLAPDE